MAHKRFWHRNSRSLAVLFLAVAVPPAATLVWLGVQLLGEDRIRLDRQDLERRQAAAQAVILSLEQSVSAAERHLSDGGAVPEGMVRFVLSERGMDAEPRARILWLPVTRPLPSASFPAEAKDLEVQDGERALGMYEEAAWSLQPELRAGALLGLARIHRSHKRWDQALGAYRSLADMHEVAIEGTPADLQARRASCGVLIESGRIAEAQRQARELQHDVLAGRWALDRPAWQLTVDDITRWTGHTVPIAPERLMLSEVADRLWRERADLDPPRRLIVTDTATVTVLLRQHDDAVAVLAIAPSVLDRWATEAIARLGSKP